MRVPGRLHITWADDNTLRIDTDAGTQTRLLHFDAKPAVKPAGEPPGKDTPPPIGNGLCAARARRKPDWEPRAKARKGRRSKWSTTQLRPGYLRKNGAPYSANTVLKEYFDLSKERNGDTWFAVTTVVEDPQYLSEPFVTSTNWKKEADGSKWNPSACSAR